MSTTWLLILDSYMQKTMDSDYDYLFKIVLTGDTGVGKTSILRRYCDDVFTSAGIPTIGVNFCIKKIKIGDDSIKVVTLNFNIYSSMNTPLACMQYGCLQVKIVGFVCVVVYEILVIQFLIL